MRTCHRFAPLLAACALALASSSPAAADEAAPPATAPGARAIAAPRSGSLSTSQGQRLALELAGFEKALIQHLKGEVPSSFEALEARRKELKARIAAAGLVPGDKKVLDDRLARSASVIARCRRLTGGAATLDPEVSKAVANASARVDPAAPADPLDQIDALLGELDRAAANPGEAEEIFENLNRRYGAPEGAAGGGGAVRVNFGAIRKTLEDTWSYTPKGAPGTNEARARNLGRDTPAPAQAQAPIAARAESRDFLAEASLSAGRAVDMIAQKLPDGAERRFIAERSERLKELFDAGRRAASAMGRDPNTFTTLDALVAYLSRQEQALADELELSDNFESMDDVLLRVAAIKSVNRELGAFMATVWEYRGFLRESLVKAQVPLKTTFMPWETFPDGAGTSGAQVVGFERGVSQFIGLRYDNPDGSSRFSGQARDGRSGLIILLDKTSKRTESLVGYDAEGKLLSALSELYDGATLTRRERLDMDTGLVEIVDYKADGTELKSTRKNTKTGEEFVRDLARDEGRFEATTKDGRREIRFLADADGAPPAISLRVEKIGTDGTFEFESLVLRNGTHIVAKSPHVNQLLENGAKNLGWELALKSLVETTDVKKRLTLGRELARETVLALGMNDDDGRMSKPLGSFLAAEARDTGDLIDPNQGAPIRFFINLINGNKNYLLIFTRRDGTKRILSGTFKQATEFEDNRGLGAAFGVSGEIEIDAAGNARQTDHKIVTEYLADGSRLTWLPPSPEPYTPQTDLGFFGKWEMWWTNEHEKTEFTVRRDLPPDPARAEWNTDGRKWLSKQDTIDREIEGTSAFGTGARWFASVPGVEQVLGLCGDTASTLYTGITSGGQIAAYHLTGIEEYRLEAAAGYSRNPLMKRLMGDSEPDREKDPGAWRAWKEKRNTESLSEIGGGYNDEILDVQAMQRREKALALQGITWRRAPQAYRDAMQAPLSDDERYDALSDFGAGTYGRRLAEEGHGFLGGVMAFGESLDEGLLNPLMYVIPGIGRAAAGTGKIGLAATSPTLQVAAKVTGFGVRAFQYALLGSVVGSFSLSALDNIGKISDYWGTPGASVKAGEGLADLAFGGLMIHGFAKERTRARLAELKSSGEAAVPAEVASAPVESVVKADATPVVAQTSAVKVDVKADAPAAPSAAPASPAAPAASASGAPASAASAPAPHAGAVVEATAAKGPPPSRWTRLKNSASRMVSEFRDDIRDPKAREQREKALRVEDVKSPTRAESNTQMGAEALDAKGAELKTAEAKTVEAKIADAKAAEAKGEAASAEVKAETKGETKGEAREEARAEVREEVREKTKSQEPVKDEPSRLRRAAERLGEKAEKGSRWLEKRPVMHLARGGVVLPLTPAMKRNLANAERNRSGWKDPAPPEKKKLETVEEGPHEPWGGGGPPDPPEDPPVDPPNDPPQDPPKDHPNRQDVSSGGGGGGGGSGGDGDGGGSSRKGPKAPSFGGFGGDGGGGGGGGGAGGDGAEGGGGGGGGGAPEVDGPTGGGGARPAGPEVSAAQPAGLSGGGPVIAAKRGVKSSPNDTAAAGGHEPSPSLASRFDGSRQRPASASSWSASGMKGLGAGDGPGLPRLTARAPSPAAPASPAGAPSAARTAGGSAAPARAGAPVVQPEDDDFSYTSMAPARHNYELPTDRPSGEKDWRYFLSLGLRGAAAAAIGYLIYYSDLPYLVGLTRRRRDGTYGA